MFQDKFVLADGTALQSNIVGVDWTTSSNSDSDIAPGSVCASAVEIEFWVNSDSALSVTQGTVLTYYKVYKDDNDIGIETKIGVFTCDKPEKTGSNKYKVTAYDNVTLLDVDVSEWLNALTFPITIKEFAAALAAKCELELANEPRLNKDYQVQKFTGSGVKARDLMKMVCSASGCFCNADANGKLFFDWYKKNERVTISPQKSTSAGAISFYLFDVVKRSLQDNAHRVLISAKSGSDAPDGIPYFANQLTFSDFVVKAIDKVQVRQSDDDVGVVYPADEQGTNALVIQGNQLLSTTSDAALRPYVKNLYDGLNNITYVPCSNIQTPETLEIKVGDIVTVSDGKNEFDTWITSVKHSGGKCTFESVGNANRNTTTAVNNVKYNSKQKILKISATVDGLTVKAEQTAQQYTQLKQTFEAFELTAVTDGNVRSKFALDSSSVAIESGTITFKGDTLVVDSDNFKLAQDGTVRITGTLTSKTTYSEAVIGNGEITLSQMVSGGSYSPAVKIYSDGTGGSYILGHIRIYGNDGYNDNRIDLYNDSAGSHFEMYTGGTHTKFFDVRADSNGEGHVSIGGVNALGYLECKRLRIDGHNVALSRVNYTNSEGTPTWEYLLTAHQGDAW
jgi:hypothetical protein|nr:MAG TPA: hypothetical protein [Bacteriophage sp.]